LAPERLNKKVLSMSILSRVCYAVFFISTVTAVVYGMVMIWGDRGGENAWKSLGTALIFLFASLLILVANNILAKNKWG
jgi:uncharacterized BrkB/YihY/UPF0761 family membrane protein